MANHEKFNFNRAILNLIEHNYQESERKPKRIDEKSTNFILRKYIDSHTDVKEFITKILSPYAGSFTTVPGKLESLLSGTLDNESSEPIINWLGIELAMDKTPRDTDQKFKDKLRFYNKGKFPNGARLVSNGWVRPDVVFGACLSDDPDDFPWKHGLSDEEIGGVHSRHDYLSGYTDSYNSLKKYLTKKINNNPDYTQTDGFSNNMLQLMYNSPSPGHKAAMDWYDEVSLEARSRDKEVCLEQNFITIYDSSLSLLGNSIATILQKAENPLKILTNHDLFLFMYINITSAFSLDEDDQPLHCIVSSFQGTGKTKLIQSMCSLMIPSTYMFLSSLTDRAYNVEINMDNVAVFFDEMPKHFLAKGADGTGDSISKQMLSTKKVVTQANVQDTQSGNRKTELLNAKLNNVQFVMANTLKETIPETILDRFAFFYLLKNKRGNTSSAILNSTSNNKKAIEEMKHFTMCIQFYCKCVNEFIEIGALEEIDTSLLPHLFGRMDKVCEDLKIEYTGYRVQEKVLKLCKTITIWNAVIKNFMTRPEPEPFKIRDILRVRKDLFVTTEIFVLAFSLLRQLFTDDSHGIICKAIKRAVDTNLIQRPIGRDTVFIPIPKQTTGDFIFNNHRQVTTVLKRYINNDDMVLVPENAIHSFVVSMTNKKIQGTQLPDCTFVKNDTKPVDYIEPVIDIITKQTEKGFTINLKYISEMSDFGLDYPYEDIIKFIGARFGHHKGRARYITGITFKNGYEGFCIPQIAKVVDVEPSESSFLIPNPEYFTFLQLKSTNHEKEVNNRPEPWIEIKHDLEDYYRNRFIIKRCNIEDDTTDTTQEKSEANETTTDHGDDTTTIILEESETNSITIDEDYGEYQNETHKDTTTSYKDNYHPRQTPDKTHLDYDTPEYPLTYLMDCLKTRI